MRFKIKTVGKCKPNYDLIEYLEIRSILTFDLFAHLFSWCVICKFNTLHFRAPSFLIFCNVPKKKWQQQVQKNTQRTNENNKTIFKKIAHYGNAVRKKRIKSNYV